MAGSSREQWSQDWWRDTTGRWRCDPTTGKGGWQEDSTSDRGRWQQDSTSSGSWQQPLERGHAAQLPPGGLLLGEGSQHRYRTGRTAWRADKQREEEVRSNRSNPTWTSRRFPESEVIRIVFPFSRKEINDAAWDQWWVEDYWAEFQADAEKHGCRVKHEMKKSLRHIDSGWGNYLLVLCGPARWSGAVPRRYNFGCCVEQTKVSGWGRGRWWSWAVLY